MQEGGEAPRNSFEEQKTGAKRGDEHQKSKKNIFAEGFSGDGMAHGGSFLRFRVVNSRFVTFGLCFEQFKTSELMHFPT